MTVVDALVAEFKRSVIEIAEKEASNPDFLNQRIFAIKKIGFKGFDFGCRFRAKRGLNKIIKNAKPKMADIATLSIATHRENKTHNEDRTEEILKSSRSLTNEEIKASTADVSYWKV